jgi:5-formaminoimidazole-4-carboxamide-1-beta-D-ribofuranosyl 5'-monophosphate synthetase
LAVENGNYDIIVDFRKKNIINNDNNNTLLFRDKVFSPMGSFSYYFVIKTKIINPVS